MGFQDFLRRLRGVDDHRADASEVDGDDGAVFEGEISEGAVGEVSELVDVS